MEHVDSPLWTNRRTHVPQPAKHTHTQAHRHTDTDTQTHAPTLQRLPIPLWVRVLLVPYLTSGEGTEIGARCLPSARTIRRKKSNDSALSQPRTSTPPLPPPPCNSPAVSIDHASSACCSSGAAGQIGGGGGGGVECVVIPLRNRGFSLFKRRRTGSNRRRSIFSPQICSFPADNINPREMIHGHYYSGLALGWMGNASYAGLDLSVCTYCRTVDLYT